ncbi:MAG: 4-phosphoerythronate dehydrogenase PdxB [Rubricoccaceae bacterium]
MLRLVADANIPAALEAFSGFGEARLLPGREIERRHLVDADVLLVRSVTRVDAALLEGTPIRFVGTATAGTDHVDADALRQLGVAFASAPGSNATSVVEYVIAALLALASDRGVGLAGRTLGVIGAGQVGSRLIPRARALGLHVVASDPPLDASRGLADVVLVELAEVLHRADILTLHTPLSTPETSAHPTLGMIDAEALQTIRPGAWLVNAARGRVVDGIALAEALGRRQLGAAVLDVWPKEPDPDPELVERVALGTPHIAGYSFDGKLAGTRQLEAALRAWVEDPPLPWDASPWLEPPSPLVVTAPAAPADASDPVQQAAWLHAVARQAYDVRADDARFRSALRDADDRASAFTTLRKTYPVRREWSNYSIQGVIPEPLREAVRIGLAMGSQ